MNNLNLHSKVMVVSRAATTSRAALSLAQKRAGTSLSGNTSLPGCNISAGNRQMSQIRSFTTPSRFACASGGVMGSVMSFFGGGNSNAQEEGVKFLAENKSKEGVITLNSGLQYKVLKEGSGSSHPLAHTECACHYEGTLLDGSKFDSSYDRGAPTTFAPNQVIRGWTEAMQLMVEGDKWELYIPPELAYGSRGAGPIPGGATLVFKMEIVKIKGPSKSKM